MFVGKWLHYTAFMNNTNIKGVGNANMLAGIPKWEYPLILSGILADRDVDVRDHHSATWQQHVNLYQLQGSNAMKAVY